MLYLGVGVGVVVHDELICQLSQWFRFQDEEWGAASLAQALQQRDSAVLLVFERTEESSG